MASNCLKCRMEPVDFTGLAPVLWLAAGVVPWHTFNLIGSGPFTPGACRGGSGWWSSGGDVRSAGSTFGARRRRGGHYHPLSKVRDEKSHVCCGAAPKAWSSIDRSRRKPSALEGLSQVGTQPTLRNHRTGRASRNQRSPRSPLFLTAYPAAAGSGRGVNRPGGRRCVAKDATLQM